MKKIITIMVVSLSLFACSDNKEPQKPQLSKSAQLLKEVKESEKSLMAMDFFKINKYETGDFISCSDNGEVTFEQYPADAWHFSVLQDGADIAYVKTQKMNDVDQYKKVYYKQGTTYVEYTNLPGAVDVDQTGVTSDYVVLDPTIHKIDTNFFDITKTENEDKTTTYNMVLTDSEGYSKEYPSDNAQDICGITASYNAQEMVVVVNEDGNIIHEVINESIIYRKGDETIHTTSSTKSYDFYDFHVPNEINFWFVSE